MCVGVGVNVKPRLIGVREALLTETCEATQRSIFKILCQEELLFPLWQIAVFD